MTLSPAKGRPQSHDWASLTAEDWASLSNQQIAEKVGCTPGQAASQRHYRGHPTGRRTRWDLVTDWGDDVPLAVIAAQAGSTTAGACWQRKRRKELAMQANVNNN